MSPRFLIIEGNTAEGRERQRTRLGRIASEGYANCLKSIVPKAITDVCMPADADANLPCETSLRDYDGVVITGSGLHLWQEQPEAMRQVELARAVFRSGVPFFGSCWGLQVASVAAGGVVEKNPAGREAGIARAISRTEAGRDHPLLAGRPAIFDAPCVHLDAVTKPAPGTTILASNAITPVQAAEITCDGGTFWGVQYHPEFSLTHLANILALNIPIHLEEGKFTSEEQALSYCDDLRAVCQDPGLTHITWRYGLGPDVLNSALRVLEIRNFIETRVIPHAKQRTKSTKMA